MELENKSIIITGASSGIGAAAATLFTAEGANVILGARRSAELEAVASKIREAGGTAVFLEGDVKDEGYAAALVDLAMREFGRLDGAFNNAGIVGAMEPVPDMGIGNWNEVLTVNLTAAFLAAKAQIPVMKKTAVARSSSHRHLLVSVTRACLAWALTRLPRPVSTAWCNHLPPTTPRRVFGLMP